jgi:tetratricopeptide (TPR) repeat protein
VTLRAVLFDVDFTLCRPGPELSAERYARIAGRHGITLDTGRYDEARAHFEAALKKDPGFGPSQHELGDVLAMLGKHEEAREAYRKSAVVAANARRSLEYRSSIALGYVRQNQYGLADQVSWVSFHLVPDVFVNAAAFLGHLTFQSYEQIARLNWPALTLVALRSF